jgi:hypothetical protein
LSKARCETKFNTEFNGRLEGTAERELYNLYSSGSIIRVTKLKTTRWVWHVAHMQRGEKYGQGFGQQVWREETTWETKAYIGV